MHTPTPHPLWVPCGEWGVWVALYQTLSLVSARIVNAEEMQASSY